MRLQSLLVVFGLKESLTRLNIQWDERPSQKKPKKTPKLIPVGLKAYSQSFKAKNHNNHIWSFEKTFGTRIIAVSWALNEAKKLQNNISLFSSHHLLLHFMFDHKTRSPSAEWAAQSSSPYYESPNQSLGMQQTTEHNNTIMLGKLRPAG